MRKALIALLAGGALATAAAPALAQMYDSSMAQREDSISARIDEGIRYGDLSPGQASRLRGELREIVDLDARYSNDGMSDWQARDIDSRLSLLDQRLNHEINMNRDYNGY